MALTAVETAIMGIMDRFAFQVKATKYVAVGGTDVWVRVDASGDETFENRVEGPNTTALDAAIEAMNIGQFDEMHAWLNDLVQYCNVDVALESIDGYLTDKLWRIDQEAKDIIEDFTAPGTVAITNVHAPADGGAAAPGLALGTIAEGGAIVSAADIDILAAAASVILGRVTAIGAADWTITPELKVAEGTTKNVEQVVDGTGGGGDVGDTYVFGAEAVGAGGAAAGQPVIPVAATAQFEEGQTVLLTEWDGVAPDEVWSEQEWGVITTIVLNTSIELTTNLLHTYTAAGFVYPCYIGVVSCAEAGGTAGDGVAFYPAPDRRLKL